MKKYLTPLFLAGFFFFSGLVLSQEQVKIDLQVPDKIDQEICPAPIWKNLTVSWDGVQDKRAEPEIGDQVHKKKEPISVLSRTPLSQVFNQALKDLFQKCGMKLVTDGSAPLHLSAQIREFHAGVKRSFLTGKSDAKSLIAFETRQRAEPGQTIEVGYEMESKRVSQGDIKQLQKALNELFGKTLQTITTTESLHSI